VPKKKDIKILGSVEFTKFYDMLALKDPLKSDIGQAMDQLKQNPVLGDRIQMVLWPKKYVKKYDINNLYRYSLGSKWRMIYTLVGDASGLVCIILGVMDHKEYDKLFGYRTS